MYLVIEGKEPDVNSTGACEGAPWFPLYRAIIPNSGTDMLVVGVFINPTNTVINLCRVLLLLSKVTTCD